MSSNGAGEAALSNRQGEQDLRWLALRVLPQREQMVAKILRHWGLNAEVKTERRLRRRTKWDKERKLITYVAAPGYVLVATDPREPVPWYQIFRLHLVRSVVSIEGVPAVLNHNAVMRFLGYEDGALPSYFRFFRTGSPEFEIGDEIIVARGVFQDHKLRVQDVQDGEAVFLIRLLGATQEVRISVNDCVKAEAA